MSAPWEAILFACATPGDAPVRCAVIGAETQQGLVRGLHESGCALAIILRSGVLHSSWTRP